MKTMRFPILILLLISTFCGLSAFAQDYTQWGLPEGAKMRLGKGSVYGNIVFSPDSTLLAVSSDIGIWIYDGHTGEELNLLTTRTGSVSSVAFSPDGKMLAGSISNEFYLWDVATGEHKATLTGHTADITSVAFSPDNKTLATGGDEKEGTVRLWDVDTGALKATFAGHTDGISSIAFSPDGNTLASSGSWKDETVKLWDGCHRYPQSDTDRTYERHHKYRIQSGGEHTCQWWRLVGPHSSTLGC